MLVHIPCFQRLGLAIIITYAPSSNASPEDHTTYYTNLDALIAKVRPRFTLLIAGDFNAEVGTRSPEQETPSAHMAPVIVPTEAFTCANSAMNMA